MRYATELTNILSAIALIKLDKITHRSCNCTAVWVCPISRDDLVYLPPKVSASLGNLGPLVICTNVTSEITLLDPFQLRESSLSADEYWKAPFEPLMTSNDLVEFVVVNADAFWQGTMYSLADVHAYRLSDFGEKCESFSVRTHLGGFVGPLGVDHIALGYDLCRAKCRVLYSLPDVVLVTMRDEEVGQLRKPVMKQRMLCQKYGKFLRVIDMNPRPTFRLSIINGNDEINGKSDMGSVSTSAVGVVDIGLEASLAHLDLGDDEGDTSMK